jgi:hypothetical protein
MPQNSKYQAIISSHTNPHLSGVAKFNLILAKKMKISCLGISEFNNIDLKSTQRVLLSLKLSDITPEETVSLKTLLTFLTEKNLKYDVFFHTFTNSSIEALVVKTCEKIFSGNLQLDKVLIPLGKPVVSSWCPSLLDQVNLSFSHKLNIFSFGMAHKLQPKLHEKLATQLNNEKIDYALYVSTAFHEKAKFGDFGSISKDLTNIYGDKIFFLGFLSDASVNYFLDNVDLVVAFFEQGVRGNNTSVYAAFEKAKPLLTNVDENSLKWIEHGKNFLNIDKIEKTDFEPEYLQKLGLAGKADYLQNASWESLIQVIDSHK